MYDVFCGVCVSLSQFFYCSYCNFIAAPTERFSVEEKCRSSHESFFNKKMTNQTNTELSLKWKSLSERFNGGIELGSIYFKGTTPPGVVAWSSSMFPCMNKSTLGSFAASYSSYHHFTNSTCLTCAVAAIRSLLSLVSPILMKKLFVHKCNPFPSTLQALTAIARPSHHHFSPPSMSLPCLT